MKLSALCALAAVLLAGHAVAAESFLGTHAPTFWHGGEFPGATGRVEVVQDELRLHYDFSGGGHYVAARFGLPERPKAKRIAFEANLPDSTEITLRIVDATGQTFQYRFSGSTDGEWILRLHRRRLGGVLLRHGGNRLALGRCQRRNPSPAVGGVRRAGGEQGRREGRAARAEHPVFRACRKAAEGARTAVRQGRRRGWTPARRPCARVAEPGGAGDGREDERVACGDGLLLSMDPRGHRARLHEPGRPRNARARDGRTRREGASPGDRGGEGARRTGAALRHGAGRDVARADRRHARMAGRPARARERDADRLRTFRQGPARAGEAAAARQPHHPDGDRAVVGAEGRARGRHERPRAVLPRGGARREGERADLPAAESALLPPVGAEEV